MEQELCNLWMCLRLLKESGIKPKRTIRAVLFMNEENGLRGGNNMLKLQNRREKSTFLP